MGGFKSPKVILPYSYFLKIIICICGGRISAQDMLFLSEICAFWTLKMQKSRSSKHKKKKKKLRNRKDLKKMVYTRPGCRLGETFL